MQTTEFLDRVRQRLGVATEDDAMRAVGATLETLGERIPKTERENLAAQLPPEMSERLQARPNGGQFSLEEFYRRVRARADTGYPQAVDSARVVCRVLQEAVSPGEIHDVQNELTADYVDLFGAASGSPSSPSRS